MEILKSSVSFLLVWVVALGLFSPALCDSDPKPEAEAKPEPEADHPHGRPHHRPRTLHYVPSYEVEYEHPYKPRHHYQPKFELKYEPVYEPVYEPKYEVEYKPVYRPKYEPHYEPKYEPRYKPKYEPEYEPRYEPKYEPVYKPKYEPHHEPKYEPHHEPKYEPHHEPKYEPEYKPKYEPEYEPKYEPHYNPQYHEICKLKEWSTDTELCTPGLAHSCQQEKLNVYKIAKPREQCVTNTVPKCKVIDEAKEVEVCSFKVMTEDVESYAKMFEQEMTKTCTTHYHTECSSPGYGYHAYHQRRPQCQSVPTHSCYDKPTLKQVNLPLKLRASRVKEDCKRTAVPMPRTKCWDEEVESCFSLPELVMREEYPSKCTVAASDDQCERVRLTIPRETCFHVEKKYPHKVTTTTSKLKVA